MMANYQSITKPNDRSRKQHLVWLGVIVILAAGLNFYNLSSLGYANHYYTAAVKSMLQSWHNFFFVAAEPGGSVTVDKPPLGLWLQAISAYFLGMNGFAVLLPQILAGIFSVILLDHLVGRSFGDTAGLLAALALATTPIAIATNRNNTIDSTLILTLLLAAWAFIIAAEKGKLRYVLLGATLVGVGFNIKMLQAFLPLPAFFALYFLGSAEGLWRKLLNLVMATVLLVIVSLSWCVIVNLTPVDQRPFVGSSKSNSEMELIIGYNGVQRLVGWGGWRRGGGPGGPPGGGRNPGAGGNNPSQVPNVGPGGGNPQFGGNNNGSSPQTDAYGFQGFPQGGNGVNTPPQGQIGRTPGNMTGGGASGVSEIGRAGWLRLFTPSLSKEASWLLPFGLFSAIMLALRSHIRWPFTSEYRALTLWGGWLITAAVFFGIAGFFHEYYLSMLAPPLAALIGIGIAGLIKAREKHPWSGIGLLLVTIGINLAYQIYNAVHFVQFTWWLQATVVLFVVGAILLTITAKQQKGLAVSTGLALVIAVLFLIPGIWSGLTVLNGTANQSLPAAYNGRASSPANRGGVQINQALLDFLQAHTQGVKYLMAVPSSMQGADYVIASGRPVLYIGGFMGQDSVVSGDDLAQMVADGELRFIYWNSSRGGIGGGGFNSQSDVNTWVSLACALVTGFDTSTRNTGAPDGTGASQSSGGGNMQVSLYDCGE